MPTLTWGFLMVKNTEGINTIFLTRNSRSKNCVHAFHTSMATNSNSCGRASARNDWRPRQQWEILRRLSLKKRNNSAAFDVKTAIYYNTLMASPILGLGLAVFSYRERAVILLTTLFLGLQNSKVDPYRKTCKMQLYRHTYLLSKTSRFLDNPFIEALRSTPQHTAQDSKPTSKKLFSQPRLEYPNSRK